MVDKTLDKINTFVPERWRWVLVHGGFRKYFKNTGWMFGAKVISLAVSFLTTVFVARELGPENYGQLSYAVSFVSLFSFIATMGLDQVLFRDLIKYPEKRNAYLGSAFTIKTISSFLAVALCFATAFYINNKDVSGVLIFIIASSFIFNAFQIISNEFQAMVKAKYPSLISLLVVVILNALKIIVIVFGKGVIYLAFILLLESLLYAAFYILLYRWKLNKKITDWFFDKKIAISLIKDSWPMIFSSAFALIYARIDQVMIKNIMSAGSVGLYDAAVRISEAWYFVPNIIITSFLPAIINAKKTSEASYLIRWKKLFDLLIIISLFVAICVTVLSPFIIHIFYGSSFSGSVNILKIYIWSSVAMAVIGLLNSYLIAENFRKILFWSSFSAMIFNVLLNILFIPKYGIIGAAWATFISYGLVPISMLFFRNSRKVVMMLFRLKSI